MAVLTGRYSMLLEGSACFSQLVAGETVCLHILKGEGSLLHGKKVFAFKGPCVALLQNYAQVCLKAEGPLNAQVVIGQAYDFAADLPPVLILPDSDGGLVRGFAALFEKSISKSDKYFADLFVLIARQAGPSPAAGPPAYLLKIKELFDISYAQELSLDILEVEFGKSRYKVVREFKEHWGCTPMEYLAKRRLDASRLMLLETELSVTEIAEQTGFATCSYYVQSFKKQFGTTPTLFRRQNGV